MAMRSGAGTGVVVSLVVTILIAVFLLVLSIVFYSGLAEARETLQQTENTLKTYVAPAQRSSDQVKALEGEARSNGQSVVGYQQQQYQALLQQVDPAVDSLDELRQAVQVIGISADQPVMDALRQAHGDLRRRENEIAALTERVTALDAEAAELRAQIDSLKQAHRQEIESVQQEIAAYRDAGDQYRRDVEDTIDSLNTTVAQREQAYEEEISDLESQIDSLYEERNVLRARIDDLERKIDEDRLRGLPPEALVDARVIDVQGSDQVFLDRGRDDRVVVGMTFEVYDSPASIRVSAEEQLSRGKASVQVIKVDESTATAKVTRSVSGRPVVRNDVVANAVYDPEYRFRFLFHGKFDIDGDGTPTVGETEYLKSLTIDWGGTVIEGTELPGDLDFLVLGVQPSPPAPLAGNATDVERRIWVERRRAVETYNALFQQAADAQIPVLNANRFLILIGHTNR